MNQDERIKELKVIGYISGESLYRLEYGGNSSGTVPIHVKPSNISRHSLHLDKDISEMQSDYESKIKELENQLAEANKIIDVIDALITSKGRYHTAQWYQKMVIAFDEYKKKLTVKSN